MSWYISALGVSALIALILSWKTPRAKLWIAGLSLSFVVSVLYLDWYSVAEANNKLIREFPFAGMYDNVGWTQLDLHWLPPSAIAVMLDRGIATAILVYGRERWETKHLYHVVMLMMLINLLYLTGVLLKFPPVPPQEILGVALEILNVAALFVIGWPGLQDILTRSGIDDMLGRIAASGHNPLSRSLGVVLEIGHSLRKKERKTLWGE